jgi:hypothetical protein
MAQIFEKFLPGRKQKNSIQHPHLIFFRKLEKFCPENRGKNIDQV